MQILSRIFFFFVFCTLYFVLHPSGVLAQDAFPRIGFPCDKDTGNDPEFHSLRPYQAAVCGDAGKARYCSNDLVFIESFDVTGRNDCTAQGGEGTFICHPNLPVDEHDLIVDLDDSMFPIMGNTEEVKNSQNSGDTFDDATKVNEYASWYLSGVNNRAEYGENTDEKTVNFSGPVQKLLPKMIQEAERIETIKKATEMKTVYDEDLGMDVNQPENHDQVVVCADQQFFGLFGKTIPKPCYDEKGVRLSDWTKDLSFFRSLSNFALNIFDKLPDWAKGYTGGLIDDATSVAWNKRFPPLPWDVGTVENIGVDVGTDETTIKTRPFKSQIAYQKAYNEWQGKSCLIILEKLFCVDNPGVTNTYADLYSYIPLANTTDKKGAQLLAPEHPIFRASAGTAIDPDSTSYGKIKNAALYFAHTQEVKELSQLLNKTYKPKDVENKRDSASTEDNYCSVVNVRANKGDNLFPGKPNGIVVPDVTYTVTEAECKKTFKEGGMERNHPPTWLCGRNKPEGFLCPAKPSSSVKCTAEVYITLHTQTKTPNVGAIFDETVAGTGSTFRKIYPKVDANAPVSCIADIPTVTDVTYTATNTLQGGNDEFKVKKYPEDGANTETPQLTFPHVGSIYEYFLKGIQTALRPQGYGNEQPISGQTCTNIECGELPKGLPKASGSCSLRSEGGQFGGIPPALRDIVNAAAETYKTPPSLIIGIMYGEGLFNKGRFNWTDANVKNWATCQKIPNCNESGDDNFMGFNGNDWATVSKGIAGDLKKLDPTRKAPNVCNLLDTVYGVAWNLHNEADGGGSQPPKCFNIDLKASVPNSCTWNDNQYASAIKASENGYDKGCFTKEGSCATGGGNDALCDNGVDGCETKDNRYNNPSHFACVWDVAHGN